MISSVVSQESHSFHIIVSHLRENQANPVVGVGDEKAVYGYAHLEFFILLFPGTVSNDRFDFEEPFDLLTEIGLGFKISHSAEGLAPLSAHLLCEEVLEIKPVRGVWI